MARTGKTGGIFGGVDPTGYSDEQTRRFMDSGEGPDPEAEREFEREQMAVLTGEGPEEEFEPWASQLYGATIKNARKRAGYSTAQAFSDTIYRRTRLYISRDVLYKIEQGRQDPDIAQFMAINLCLYNAPFPSRVTMACICPEWVNIASNEGQIPIEWRTENTAALEEATGEKFSTAAEAAKAAKDDPNLFTYGSAGAAK